MVKALGDVKDELNDAPLCPPDDGALREDDDLPRMSVRELCRLSVAAPTVLPAAERWAADRRDDRRGVMPEKGAARCCCAEWR